MRGIYAITLVIAIILVFLGLSSAFFSLNYLNRAFLDYRKALYQSYLAHDIEYSLRRLLSAIRIQCSSVSDPTTCNTIANSAYASFVAAWAANGISITGGGVSVLVLPETVDVRLAQDLSWQMGEYSGNIPAGYGVS